MNTNHEVERIVQDWLEERVVAPQLDGLHRTLSQVPTTPQARARLLGRWFDRGGGDRRRADAHASPLDSSRRNRLMLTVSGIAAALAALAITANVIETAPAPPSAGAGAAHVVAADGSGDFATISEAVTAAEAGDTVLIRPGRYVEVIVVDKDITLTGDGPREEIVISAPEDGPVADMDGWAATEAYAVQLLDTSATFSNATLEGQRSVVHARGGSPTISGLHLAGVGVPYRGGSSPAGNSIMVDRASTATVADNRITDGGPIGVFGRSAPLIEGNELVDGPHIWGGFGDGAIIRGNTISNPFVRAIGVFDLASVVIEGNTIAAAADSAMDLDLAAGSIVRDNTITGGSTGLNIDAGAPEVSDNVIEGVDGPGIVLGIGASPVLTGNRLCGNLVNLQAGSSFELDASNEICEDETAE